MPQTMQFQGAFTALVTPFRNGEIDFTAFDALIEAQIAGGITGLVPCGTTGESPTLTSSEQRALIARTVERAGNRASVIAGTGTNSTRETIERTRAAQEVGANAAMLVMPYYNRPTQRGLIEHVRAVHDASELPLVLYNVPARTSSDLALESLVEIAEKCPRVVAVKEATGNVLRTQQIVATLGDRLAVLSGDDVLTLGIVACGGCGVISVASNVAPGEVARSVRAMLAGNWAEARKLHFALLRLYDSLFVETNPGPAKAALALRGQIAPEIRLPMAWPTEKTVETVRLALRASGMLG